MRISLKWNDFPHIFVNHVKVIIPTQIYINLGNDWEGTILIEYYSYIDTVDKGIVTFLVISIRLSLKYCSDDEYPKSQLINNISILLAKQVSFNRAIHLLTDNYNSLKFITQKSEGA